MEISDLLTYAMQIKASDLFLDTGKPPAVRLNGEVHSLEAENTPDGMIDAFRKSVLSKDAETTYLKTGSADAACMIENVGRFRLNFLGSCFGAGVVVRPIQSGSELFFKPLGLPAILGNFCDAQRGLILVVGATGSGKTTTLGAMLNYINERYFKHILTIEDPIEYLHADKKARITQRELSTDVTDFKDALRSAMRESPDVIVIGEMRDLETVQTALTASLTGHLVISTVHTADATQAIERIINLFPDDQRKMIADDLGHAIVGIVAQRLLPRLDKSGMVPALEILVGTPSMQKLIAAGDYKGIEDALKSGTESGMVTFNRNLFRMYKEKIISLEDAEKVAGNREEFRLQVKGMESGVDAFRNHYGNSEDAEDGKFIDMRRLLRTAVKIGASDLHISVGAIPTLRLNGTLRNLDLPALNAGDAQRLLYSVLSPRQRVEFEEKREIDFALSVAFRANQNEAEQFFRFRVNGYFQRGNVGVAARVINTKIPTPEELTIPPQMMQLMTKQQGLILITGPTGSGKSTSLASLINRVNETRSSHIITVEDPIEYVHSNKLSLIEQREVHSDTMSFFTALKYALRQDPDVIMVGEMRDIETIGAALTAAETGHLVLGTLHTNSATQTIDRIIDSFPAHQQNQIKLQLSSVLLAVVSQRLLPKKDGQGRVAAFEIMVGTPPVQALIREGKTSQLQSQLETGYRDGMITLERSLEELFNKGLVTREEIQTLVRDYKPQDAF